MENIREKVLKVAGEFKESAKKMLLKDGHVYPVAFLVKEDGVAGIALEFDQDGKRTAYAKLCKFAQEQHALGVITINECWVGTNMDVAPSEDENRKEGIFIMSLGRGFTDSLLIPFTRDGDDITFGTEEDMNTISDGAELVNNLTGSLFKYDA